MGEVHLEIIIDRLKREFNVNANVGKPQVSFREAIQKSVEKIDEKFVRQSGGRGQYGHVVINVKPTAQGEGYKFINSIENDKSFKVTLGGCIIERVKQTIIIAKEH